MTALDGDYFKYDEEHYEMVGEATGKTYRLGEQVKVKCIGADKLQRIIDFKMIG